MIIFYVKQLSIQKFTHMWYSCRSSTFGLPPPCLHGNAKELLFIGINTHPLSHGDAWDKLSFL
jgi:hypothetical protein